AHAAIIIAALYRPLGTADTVFLTRLGALYGSLVAIFEVLNGGIPVALALLCVLTGLSAPSQWDFFRRLSILALAFLVALVTCFSIKLGVVSIYTGENAFTQHAGALLHRFRGDVTRETALVELLASRGIDFNTVAGNPFYSVALLLVLYGYWSKIIAWGSSI